MTALNAGATLAAQLARFRVPRLRLTLRARLLLLGLLGLFASALVALLALHQIHAAAASAAQSLATHTATTLTLQFQYAGGAAADSGSGLAVEPVQRLIDFIHQREGRDLELVDRNLRAVADADHADVGKRLDGQNASIISATLADGQPRAFEELVPATGTTLHQIVVAVAGGEGKPAAYALVFEYNALLDEMNAAADARTR